MQLRLEATLSTTVHHSQCLVQHSKPFLSLPYFPIRLSQQGKKIRPGPFLPRGPPSGQALAYLRNPLLSLSLLAQHPTPQDSSPRQPEREPLLARERNHCLCPLLGYLPCPADLMEPGGKE